MAGRRTKLELSQVIREFGRQLIEKDKLWPQQTKVLHNIVQCRTASLGGHEEACDHCGEIRYSYNSCGDRHCPKCLATKQAVWIEKLMESTLPVKHYHIIFTVPHCLNAICLWDAALYNKLLFRAVWGTLFSFGYSHFGVLTGAVAVLHTWGQNLSLHPHIHCLVPAAGAGLRGQWKNIGTGGNYLYPVHQLSAVFKGRFIDSLDRKLRKVGCYNGFSSHINKAKSTKWVVNCQPSMAKPEHVIRYLGQYTHRVAISNNRILDIGKEKVTFIAKDYRDGAQKKPVMLDGVEFLRRFLLHILPKGFVKIRRFGIYHPTTIKSQGLQFVPEEKPDIEQLLNPPENETPAERTKRLTGFDPLQCPTCKKGKMVVIDVFPRVRSPAGHLPSLLLSKLI